jgi:hypothetical protein
MRAKETKMVKLLGDPLLDAMAADWLRKHRHGVDTSEAYDDLRQLLAEVRGLSDAERAFLNAAESWRNIEDAYDAHRVRLSMSEKLAALDVIRMKHHDFNNALAGLGAETSGATAK